MFFIQQHNRIRREILDSHLALLEELEMILEKLQEGVSTSRACFLRYRERENMFLRRMGMRQYFKELVANMRRMKLLDS